MLPEGTYVYVDEDGLLYSYFVDGSCSYRTVDPSVFDLDSLADTAQTDAPRYKHPQDLRYLLLKLFRRLDRNHDGFISRTEVDYGVAEAILSPEESQLLVLIKRNYDRLQELRKIGWLPWGGGVALADLLAPGALDPVEMGTTNACLRLFASIDNPIDSIKPEAVRQGYLGDCVFLAALGSVAATNPPIIFHMIEERQDGKFIVTFPGAPDEPIAVTMPTHAELSLYARASEHGIWAPVLEKAYGLYLVQHGKSASVIPSENIDAHECVFEALDLLTGQMGRWLGVSAFRDEALRDLLSTAWAERRAVVAGSRTTTLDALISSNHAFSVIGWDRQTERITLRDPWGREPIGDLAPGSGGGSYGAGDGVIVATLGSFRRNFNLLYLEEWLPSPDTEYKRAEPKDKIVAPWEDDVPK